MIRIILVSQDLVGGERVAITRMLGKLKLQVPQLQIDYIDRRNVFIPSQFGKFGFFKYFFGVINNFRRYFNQLKKDKQIIYMIADPIVYLAFKLSNKTKHKNYLLFHGLRTKRKINLFKDKYYHILTWAAENLAWKLADKIIVPCIESKQEIQARVNSADVKFLIVPNLIPQVFFANNKAKARKNLLYVGRLVKGKNIKLVVDIFEKLVKIPKYNDLSLTICFPSNGSDLKILKNLQIKVKNSKHKIKLLSDLDENQLAQQYKSSFLLLLPSDLEFAPLVVLEAMAAGCLPLTSAVGFCPRILGGVNNNLIVSNYDLEEWLKRVEYWLERSSADINAVKLSLSNLASDNNARLHFLSRDLGIIS